jgi:hypothetical protein
MCYVSNEQQEDHEDDDQQNGRKLSTQLTWNWY